MQPRLISPRCIAKLDNPNFIERAKPEAVAEARDRKAELENAITRWKAALTRLEA